MSKLRVLFVDDDESLLAAIRRSLHANFDVSIANGPKAALDVLANNGPFAVVVSDQRMPEFSGTAFLSTVRDLYPLTVRVMLTGNADLGTAIAAVNSSKVYRFVTKPCNPEQLIAAVEDAGRQHALMTAEKEVLEKTLSGSVRLLMDVLSMSHPVAFATAGKVRRWAVALSKVLKFERTWELEMAAMLWPIGEVTLPSELQLKREQGKPLTDMELALVRQTPTAGRDLISHIPRLAGVAEGVAYCRKDYDGSGYPDDGVSGEALPRIARLLHILIDLAEAEPNLPDPTPLALSRLMTRRTAYDPVFIRAAAQLCAENDGETSVQPARIPFATENPTSLVIGDLLVQDLTTTDGRLLLAKGAELNGAALRKLRAVAELARISTPIKVLRETVSAPPVRA